jgi:integrase
MRLLKTPGRHTDGQGLYFRVLGDDKAYFTYRYTIKGKERELSIGPFPELSLTEAREKHAALRKQVMVDKVDVLAARRDERTGGPSFGEIADKYLAVHQSAWRNAKHRWQWEQSLTVYAAPIRDMPVAEIDTEAVLGVLEPMWTRVPETASRLRGRIEQVLDAARARGHIPEDKANPARWRGHLDKLLPKPQKLGSRYHLAAMPYTELPGFLAKLRTKGGTARRALEMVILCASRPGEVLGMAFDEIDLDAAKGPLWTIPASRTKTAKEHMVPLSDRAVVILRAQIAARRNSNYVFPSPLPGKSISNAALSMLMQRLGQGEMTVHGTARSGFRDWAAENHVAFEVAEQCLAHMVGNAVTRSYLRTTMLERRRPVLQAWADFLAGKAADNVVALRAAAG